MKRPPARLPPLRTRRLVLRPLRVGDARAVAAILGDARVAAGMIHVPHPLPEGAAPAWIARHVEAHRAGGDVRYAIVRRGARALIGTIGLRLNDRHDHAELGYWLAPAWWGRGYVAEAGRALLAWAFPALALRRVYGQYLGDNVASGRVMTKLGMRAEGVRRQHLRRGDAWYDAHQFGILAEELSGRRTKGST